MLSIFSIVSFLNFSDSNVRRVRRRDAVFGRGEQEREPHPGQHHLGDERQSESDPGNYKKKTNNKTKKHHLGGERQSESNPGNYKMGTQRLKMRYEENVLLTIDIAVYEMK